MRSNREDWRPEGPDPPSSTCTQTLNKGRGVLQSPRSTSWHMVELRKSRRRLCLPRERNLKPVTQPIHVIFLQSRGVYFSRNFNSKPVLHNYPDLFKTQGGYRSDSIANKRPLLCLVTKKIYIYTVNYILFSRFFSFFTCFQNNDRMSCSALKAAGNILTGCSPSLRNGENQFKNTFGLKAF